MKTTYRLIAERYSQPNKTHIIDSAKATVARLHSLPALAEWAWIPGSAKWTPKAHTDFADAYYIINPQDQDEYPF